jgi:hypothetical protein
MLHDTNSRESVPYVEPEVRDYGDLAELTAGSRGGNALDAAFPVNTLRRDLTFS